MYKTEVAVCSEIRKKHSTQSAHHVEFFNVKRGGSEPHVAPMLNCFNLLAPEFYI